MGSSLVSAVIVHPALLVLLPLRGLCCPPIDLRRFEHVVGGDMLASRDKKLLAMRICDGNSLLALASLGYRDRRGGLPLPNFILPKLRL